MVKINAGTPTRASGQPLQLATCIYEVNEIIKTQGDKIVERFAATDIFTE